MDHIPAIHNYYSDLLISLANYFDKILGDNTIKHYEFNIGNKSLQLNYKSQISLPSALINYNSSQMQEYYDWFLHRVDVNNPMLIPIVYDATKNLSLYLQEAQYEHSVSVIFNCQSVMEMLELQHKIEVYLPYNKYIEVFNYYTFFQIPQYYLNSLMFDINKDVIYNLFTKRDTITNEMSQMASVKYDPMIRLNSLSPGGISTDNNTFQLNLDITILNTVPLYFQIPPEEIPDITKKINEIIIKNICIPIYENVPIIRLKFAKDDFIFLPLLNIIENNFKTNFIHNNTHYELFGHIDSKYEQYTATIESDNYSYPVSLKIIKTHTIFNIHVEGALIGEIINPIWEPGSDEITGNFKGVFNTNNQSIRFDIYEPVTLILNKNTKIVSYIIHKLKLKNLDKNKFIKVIDYITIPYGILTLFDNNFNDNRLNFIPEKSLITNIGYYNSFTKNVEYFKHISNISENGNIHLELNTNINDKIEYFNIDGCINSSTWKTSFVQNEYQDNTQFQSLFIIINGTFNNAPKYGGSYIHNINFDIIGGYEPSPIYTPIVNNKYFHNFIFAKENTNNIIYNVAIPNIADYIRLDCEYAYINLLIDTNNLKLSCDLDRYYWSLFFRDKIYNRLNSNFILEECIAHPFYYAIALKIPIEFYTLYFAKYKKFNDIFYFKLYSPGDQCAHISK